MQPRYERFAAWRRCHELLLEVYRATESFPKSELYGLTAQARRAAFSAAANIAEGASKRGPAEFRRFLDMAVGSLNELAYILRVASDLRLINAEAYSHLDNMRNRAGALTWRLYAAVARSARNRAAGH